MRNRLLACILAAALGAGAALGAAPARACGGLFCDSSQPVNQAAERIIFADNGDGTVTAVIEIQYEGPAELFSWVLPVPGVPEVGISSTMAFDRLQAGTNPDYRLNTTFESCDEDGEFAPTGAGTSGDDADFGGDGDGDGAERVIVLDSGQVGPFDYETLSVLDGAEDAAQVALDWLEDNGYDVTALGPDVLRPYLEDGLNLLAFRLSKQESAGAVRPISITYAADKPFIPIRPTAVAANDDMGVMVWVLGEQRAVPDNYKALELNEARIDWFNPNDNYDDVVSLAADEAGGQGFVTEMAGERERVEQLVVGDWEREMWQDFMARQDDVDALSLLFDASDFYGDWDGFADAVAKAVELPESIPLDDFLGCPACYSDDPGVVLDAAALLREVFEQAIKPMFETEDLLRSRPYVTRLYTTMSADEMTMDPSFDFNPDLDDVDNVHTADQVVACDDSFRIELPSGDVIIGQQTGVWPDAVAGQPANRRIMQLSTSGGGEMVVDNSEVIAGLLREIDPGDARARLLDMDGNVMEGAGSDDGDDGGLCAAGGRPSGSSAGLLLVPLAWLLRRRRR